MDAFASDTEVSQCKWTSIQKREGKEDKIESKQAALHQFTGG
jgi:hypothetical protein